MNQSAAIEVAPSNASAIQRHQENELTVDDLVRRVGKVQEVAKRVMQKDLHFGNIPGVAKPTLLKPGAEILCLTFRLAPVFSIDEISLGDGHRDYRVKCTLVHAPTGMHMGDGHGSCSTKESKYAWRQGERKCPTCGTSNIRHSKEGGWFCWKKLGGCGATFGEKDQAIVGQNVGRVANPDIADTYNTVLKMACKRALVAAVLIVSGASALFTQDVEEMPQFGGDHDPERKSEPPPAPLDPAVADDFANRLRAATTPEAVKAIGLEIKDATTAKRLSGDAVKRLRSAANAQLKLIAERPAPDPDDDGREPGDDSDELRNTVGDQ